MCCIRLCFLLLTQPNQKTHPLSIPWVHVTLITQVNENPSYFTNEGKIILGVSCLPRVVEPRPRPH